MRNNRVLIAAASYNLAESHRMSDIGAALQKMGMTVFALGEGEYSSLLKNDFVPVSIPYDKHWYTKERIDKLMHMDEFGNDYCSKIELSSIVCEEINLLQKIDPAFVVTGYRTTLSISCRAVKIPLVWVLSAVISSAYFEAGLAEMPWRKPINYIKNISDSKLQSKFFSKLATKNAGTSKVWINLQNDLGLKQFKSDLDVFKGEFNLLSDAPELFPFLSNLPPNVLFCGPLFMKKNISMPQSVQQYINNSRLKIFVTMGSSGEKQLFLKLLSSLTAIEADIFVATTSILDKSDIQFFLKNTYGEKNSIESSTYILKDKIHARFIFEKSFPHRQMAEWVDLSIIHGGQGTIYNSLVSGKPFIGIPMFSEQQYNLGNLERFNCMVRIKEEEITQEFMSQLIKKITTDPSWIENAKLIKNILIKYFDDPACNAAFKAAENIISFGEFSGW